MRVSFIVPGQPIPQERPLVLRAGWTIDRPRSKAAKETIAQYGLAARQSHQTSALTGDIYLKVKFYGLRGNADLSNAVKLVEDALNGVLWIDDKQITRLRAVKITETKEPRTEIEVFCK